MASRSRFASRGAFDALASTEGDYIEDDLEEQETSASAQDGDDERTAAGSAAGEGTPGSKLTRGARRRAAKERSRAISGRASLQPVAAQSQEADDGKDAGVKEALTNQAHNGTSQHADIDVMTTRSGRSHPRASVEPEQHASSPASNAATRESFYHSSSLANQPIVEITRPSNGISDSMPTPSSKSNGTSGTSLKPPPQTFLSNSKSKKKAATPTSSADESKAFWKKVYDRTLFTFVMIGGFVGLLCMGHPYVIILVLCLQVLVYREVTALFNIPGRPSVTGAKRSGATSAASSQAGSAVQSEDEDEERIEGRRKEELWSKTLSWYFFAVSNYFLYGESIIYYFKHIVFVDAYFIPFARHHRFLSFMLYIFGFVAFVSGLKRENLKHQFGLFCWVHMSLLLIVYSSHFMVNNILEGLIWFFVPASLVICNDVFAYVCGMLFGRTPLISLSPKKTVEGFVGAFIITEIFAFGWATIFQRFHYMICPALSLGMNVLSKTHCNPNAVFLWQAWPIPPAIAKGLTGLISPVWEASTGHALVIDKLPYTGFQLHSLVMAAFASLVAPFGGFFASGFKRAFNIKDFGDSIPGHGGLTDRFDCQFLMGLFSYVYYSSLIREHHVTIGSVLQTVVTHLSIEEQAELYRELTRYMRGQGIQV